MKVANHLDFQGASKLIRPLLDNTTPSIEAEISWDSINKKIRFFNGINAVSLLDNNDISANSDFTQDTSKLATRALIKSYVENTINAYSNFRGSFDASAGTFPTGTIKAGDYWYISVAGTLTGLTPVPQVTVGDMLVANTNNPSNAGGWFVLQSNFDTSQDILIGGTFTPSAGTILGTDSIKTALQKLQGNINASTFSFTNGLTNTSGVVRLGGALTGNTNIEVPSNTDFSISGQLFGNGLFIKNTVGTSIEARLTASNGANNTSLSLFNSFNASSEARLSSANVILQNVLSNFTLGANNITLTDGRTVGNRRGIEYGADYSLEYSQRSLVDKQYVDNLVSGLSPKESVRVATTTNITLSGLQTIDGITLVAGNRVLVKNQTNAVQNGVYVANAGAWTRATDFDDTPSNLEVRGGTFVFVTQGTTQSATGWIIVAAGDVAVGTDALSFVQVSQSTAYTFNNGLSLTSNTAQLGGSLLQDTNINKAGFLFTLSGSGAIDLQSQRGRFRILDNGVISFTNTATNTEANLQAEGLVYSTDLSNVFINESLVTKRYVDNLTKFFAQEVSLTANTPLNVTHNLNLANRNNLVVQCWVNNELAMVDVSSVDTNNLTITSQVTQNARIVIFGR